MSQTFLAKILTAKQKEMAALPQELLAPLRETYSFYDFVKEHGQHLQVIAEVKKASPSLGDINLDVDLVQQAKTYEANGAAMISVLTDQEFFKGHLDYLRAISSQVKIPTLAKDFILDEKQLIRSHNAGATVVLLIVAALSEERLQALFDFATELGLEVLVETHNAEELALAHRIGAKIIGINNRNLTTFQTDIETSLNLADQLQPGPVYISESAITGRSDVLKLAPYFDGILVGTALMTADHVADKIKELQVDKG